MSLCGSVGTSCMKEKYRPCHCCGAALNRVTSQNTYISIKTFEQQAEGLTSHGKNSKRIICQLTLNLLFSRLFKSWKYGCFNLSVVNVYIPTSRPAWCCEKHHAGRDVKHVQSLRVCNLPDTWCDPPSGKHTDDQLTVLGTLGRVKVIHLEYFPVCQTALWKDVDKLISASDHYLLL